MSSKQNQRFAGLFITAMGAIFTSYNWYLVFYYGRFLPKLTFFGSILIVFGLSATLFPKQFSNTFSNASGLELTKFSYGVFVTAIINGCINIAALELLTLHLSK